MATYNVAYNEIGAYEKTLVANVVDTVTFQIAPDKTTPGWVQAPPKVEIINEGATGIYGKNDGANPTVGGANCWYIPPMSRSTVSMRDSNPDDAVPVKLISSGTPKYSVARVQ